MTKAALRLLHDRILFLNNITRQFDAALDGAATIRIRMPAPARFYGKERWCSVEGPQPFRRAIAAIDRPPVPDGNDA